jgi:hypothetical protein
MNRPMTGQTTMPAVENSDLDRMFDACQRLTDTHSRMARTLHAAGLIPEIIRLRLIAEADQIDAVIADARRLAARGTYPVTAPSEPV